MAAVCMASDRPDPFVRFATQRGLQMSAVDLPAAPRDVLAPPSDLEWYTLVTLSRTREKDVSIHALFVTQASDPRPPSMRDVLWWLSADSWAIEQSARDLDHWSATYRYLDDDPATLRLFRLHVEQAKALETILGEAAYRDLLAIYEAEVTGSG